MLEQKTFKINSRKEEFRVGKISAIEMLTLQTQINFNSMTQTETVFSFILEHIEVNISGTWTPIKEKGRELYIPLDLEQDILALQEIVVYFLNDVLKPIFKKSKE